MISYIIAVVAILTILEFWFGDQKLAKSKYWWQRVLLLQLLVFLIVSISIDPWQEKLTRFQLFHLSSHLNSFVGGLVSYFLGSFIFYWWHRARHEWPLFWRLFHQIHHSPSRIQAVTAFYVHPLEAVASSLVNALFVLCVLGLSYESLLWNGTFMGLAGMFYHMNLETPHWVGYFVQRPEMHRYHHKLGHHAGNYSDLPVWDMLFKTFYNPRTFKEVCGFVEDRELKFFQMLAGKDVNGNEQKA